MFKSLWFRLSACFTVLIFSALMFLSMLPVYILEAGNFQLDFVPQVMQEAVNDEVLVLLQAIKEKNSDGWQALAVRNISDKLTNIDYENDSLSLRSSFKPNIYFKVMDSNNALIFSEPKVLPDAISDIFLSSITSSEDVLQSYWKQNNDNYFWLTQPLIDNNGKIQGYIHLLFIAVRESWSPIFLVLKDNMESFFLFVSSLFFMGLVCGITAAWLVMRRLRAINKVTAIWREGDFTPRIKVGRFHDDEFTKHSRYLNAMADDLVSLFSLQQRVAVAEERNRVARELHDTVKQNLFALNLQLASIKYKNQDTCITEHIIEAKKITREAQTDLIEILTQLHPPKHDENRFYTRIEILSDDILKRFNVEVKWNRKELMNIAPKQEHALIRVTQESISNAIRHGQSTKIVLNLFQEEGINHWQISDNGTGFFIQENNLGFGLISMRNRIEELPNGKFSIGSNDDGGTTIKVEWMGS